MQTGLTAEDAKGAEEKIRKRKILPRITRMVAAKPKPFTTEGAEGAEETCYR